MSIKKSDKITNSQYFWSNLHNFNEYTSDTLSCAINSGLKITLELCIRRKRKEKKHDAIKEVAILSQESLHVLNALKKQSKDENMISFENMIS